MKKSKLKELFKDIQNNKVDIIVVYKVDRLTRSLLDFAKIVELFDSNETSFVSVTQNFNTTTSMGRLTLNILLSFAQFEREVTGERIRDKISASKKKGMWMGGRVPIGYQRKDKKLIIDEVESVKVQNIFKKYLELKSVLKLKEYLIENNIKTNSDNNFEKGQLYHILKNQIYIGKITHKNNIYDGEHKGIIDINLFNNVQKLLIKNAIECKEKSNSTSLLIGKLFDDKGYRMSPSHSKTRKKKYRYYVSQAITKFKKSEAGTISKLPAEEIEKFVIYEIKTYFSNIDKIQIFIKDLSLQNQKCILSRINSDEMYVPKIMQNIIEKIIVSKNWVEIVLSKNKIKETLYNFVNINQEIKEDINENIIIKKEVQIKTGSSIGCKTLIINKGEKIKNNINETLIKAIVRSFYWNNLLITGEAKSSKDIQKLENMKDSSYIKQILNLRFMSPKIVELILNGKQPDDLTISKLFKIKTLSWQEQEHILLG